jgi:hypothetical protein
MKRAFKGIWIPSEIYLNEELSLQEIFLLAEIDSLDGGEGCFANNRHFEKRLRLSEKSIRDYIKSLKSKGYVEVEHNKRNNTRKIFSLVKLRVAEKTFGEISTHLRRNIAEAPAKSRSSIYNEEKTIENTSLEKNTKKENSQDQTVKTNEMVDTESKIPSDSKKEKLNANFEYVWKKYSEACKKQNRRPGNKTKSSKLFDYAIKNKWASEVVESILFYAEDCILRNCYLKNLESFLSKSENYIEEWKNGSENHQALLELKKNGHKQQKNPRGFETKTERMNREVLEHRNQIARVLSNENEIDLPFLEKNNTRLLS